MCTTCATTWQDREQARFDDGTYRKVPVALEYPVEHYLHLSVTETEGDTVAYTPSAGYGERDRQVRLKFGRYLKKTFTGMSDADIQANVTALKSALSFAESKPELRFATDRETINQIFETRMFACGSTVESCMYNKFESNVIRPYHVYADSPDVAVAYVMADGAIVSRSVVSTKDQIWVRAYSVAGGDNDADCGTLKAMLADAGYKKGDLDGNRLSKVGMLFPYIDNGGGYVRDAGKYWVVCDEDDAEYKCENTDGTADEVDNRDRCSVCEEPEDDCQCSYCDCCQERYANGCDDCSTCEVCERCTEHDRCHCDRCSECSRLLENRYGRECECSRCSECSELDDDCECSKCDVCGELEGSCTCSEDESEDETRTVEAETVLQAAIRAVYRTATPPIPDGYESIGECRPGRNGETVLGYSSDGAITGAIPFTGPNTIGVQPRLILRAIPELTTREVREKLNRVWVYLRDQSGQRGGLNAISEAMNVIEAAFNDVKDAELEGVAA